MGDSGTSFQKLSQIKIVLTIYGRELIYECAYTLFMLFIFF